MVRTRSQFVQVVVLMDLAFLVCALPWRLMDVPRLLFGAPREYFSEGVLMCCCEPLLAVAMFMVVRRVANGERIPLPWAALAIGATLCSMFSRMAVSPLHGGRPVGDIGFVFLFPRGAWLFLYICVIVAEMCREQYMSFDEWRSQSKP